MANSNNDFFALLEAEQQKNDPQTTDEIIFRNTGGKMKVLKGGQVFDYGPKDKPVIEPPKMSVVAAAIEPKPLPPPSPIIQYRVVAPIRPPAGQSAPVFAPAMPGNIDEQAISIINKLPIKPANDDDFRRLKNIIISRLRDVRTQVQIKDVLTNPATAGGLGFDKETADKILAVINQELNSGETAKEFKLKPLPISTAGLAYPAPGPQPLAPINKPLSAKPKAAAASAELANLEKEMKDILQAGMPLRPVSPLAPRPVSPLIPRKVPAPAASAAKPKIEEIKYQSKLVSPIEEIRSMKIIDFRRLADTPEAAIKKVEEKINLLEAESFAKKHEAIKAWKESEISRLYLELGEQGMEEKKSMAEIVGERLQAGQPTLTEAEVEAVIELNQKLRY